MTKKTSKDTKSTAYKASTQMVDVFHDKAAALASLEKFASKLVKKEEDSIRELEKSLLSAKRMKSVDDLEVLRRKLEIDLAHKSPKPQTLMETNSLKQKYGEKEYFSTMKEVLNYPYSTHSESTTMKKPKDDVSLNIMKDMLQTHQDDYHIGLIKKRNRDPEMEKELKNYLELIGDSLFDEIFELLEKNASKIEDSIEQKRYIRSMLSGFFDEKIFEDILENGKWAELGAAMSRGLQRPFFEDIRNRFGTILDEEEANIISSVLIIDGKLEEAKTFLPHANRDLSIYKSTVESIIASKNIQALKFICENFDNIHFNSDELLSKLTNMKTEAITMLIDDFGFNLSTQNKLKNNLAINMVTAEDLDKFAWLNKNYGSQINYNHEHIFAAIAKSPIRAEFYSVMLENPHLKQPHLARIGDYIFSSNVVRELSQSDIYEKFFTHNAFDEQSYCLGSGYFIYGLLSRIGLAAKSGYANDTRGLVRILQTYLNIYPSDNVPDAVEFHIVGSAVHVAKVGNSQETSDACIAVMRRFGQYINKPNPSGLLPIQQVEKGSALERLLLNNGAIHPEPEPTFWTNVFGTLRGKKEKPKFENNPQLKNSTSDRPASAFASISGIRTKMRNDFRAMQTDLTGGFCDPSIKMKCENMFLKAEKVSMVMEKNNLTAFTDELHFLSENFSNYLKKSLSAYITLVKTSTALDDENQASIKSEKARKMCMEHIVLLTEQLDLMTSNISSGLNDTALSELKVRGKFLEERFNQTLVRDDSQVSLDDSLNSELENGSVQIRKKNKP